MFKNSKISIRFCLIAGFVTAAVLILVTGASCVFSLHQIKLKATDSASAVSRYLKEQVDGTKLILQIGNLLQNIKDAESIDNIRSVQQDIVVLKQTDTGDIKFDQHDTVEALCNLLSTKRIELESRKKLDETNHILEDKFTKLYKNIASAVDTVTFDSILHVEDTIEKTKGFYDSNNTNIDSDLNEISSEVVSTIDQSKASLNIQILGHQLDVYYKEVMLSSDPAYINYVGKAVESIYLRINNELESLPDQMANDIRPLVEETHSAASSVLATKNDDIESLRKTAKKNEKIFEKIAQFNLAIGNESERIMDDSKTQLSKINLMVYRRSATLLIISILAFAVAAHVGIIVPGTFSFDIKNILKKVSDISKGDLTNELSKQKNE